MPRFKTQKYSNLQCTLAPNVAHLTCLQSCLVGIVVPDPETIKKWCKDTVGAEGTIQELCKNKVSSFTNQLKLESHNNGPKF